MTDAIPDEPLGSHVLELEIADVVTETDDARSLVFRVPEGPQIPRYRRSGCATPPASSLRCAFPATAPAR